MEGGKDVWGASEQESKAMEELIHSLAFVEQNYCLFVYNNRWEFWEGKRNETTSTIDLTSEIIWIQGGGNVYQTKINRILDLIIMALVKQLLSGEVTIAAQIAAYRAKRCNPQVETHGDFAEPVCNACYSLMTPIAATNLVNGARNAGVNIPQPEV